jgi:adenylosuccinate synthase
MAVIAVVGAQWGDEGKGNIVELLASEAAIVAKYAGGYDPGSSIVLEGERLVLHIAPAALLRMGARCLLGQGMAIDPRLLLDELATLEQHGAGHGRLEVCQRALVVLPHHVEIDRLRDEALGASGAPRRGVGPAFGDEVLRRAVHVGDLIRPSILKEQVRASVEGNAPLLASLGGKVPDTNAIIDAYSAFGERLRDRIVDGGRVLHDVAKAGKRVVIEGGHGTMVDIDHGYYPYVVAASTVAGGAAIGTGIAPRLIDRVVGVAKAYTTRSGAGPLPSELTGELANRLIDIGGEISPTTARPRRCGMFDIPVLRYAARVNGFDSVALTKLDVLSALDEIPVCVGYELDGEVRDEPPYEGGSRMQPLMEMLPGWKSTISDCREWTELPANARRYVEFIEQTSGVPIDVVKVGTDRAQTIVRKALA